MRVVHARLQLEVKKCSLTSVSWKKGVFGVAGCAVEKVVLEVAPDHKQASLNDILKTESQEKQWPSDTVAALYSRRIV